MAIALEAKTQKRQDPHILTGTISRLPGMDEVGIRTLAHEVGCGETRLDLQKHAAQRQENLLKSTLSGVKEEEKQEEEEEEEEEGKDGEGANDGAGLVHAPPVEWRRGAGRK